MERLLLLYIVVFIQSYFKDNDPNKIKKYDDKINIYEKLSNKKLNDGNNSVIIQNINDEISDDINNDEKGIFDIFFRKIVLKINETVIQKIIDLNILKNLMLFYEIVNKYIILLKDLYLKINNKDFVCPTKLYHYGGNIEYYKKYLKYKTKYLNSNK